MYIIIGNKDIITEGKVVVPNQIWYTDLKFTFNYFLPHQDSFSNVYRLVKLILYGN